MKSSTYHRIRLGNRVIDYRVVRAKSARSLRVRVGPAGVEVVQPFSRASSDVFEFLADNERWLMEQLDRASRLRGVRRQTRDFAGKILFRGEPTQVRIETTASRAAGNVVRPIGGELVVSRGAGSTTPVGRSLESWLRREARREIERHIDALATRLGQRPERVYVMGQRTKWGNCSSRRNLSFNWRLILAPDYVLRYLVTHEAVHLVVPDHSAKFWLTVQSLCPVAARARTWLVGHSRELAVDLDEFCEKQLAARTTPRAARASRRRGDGPPRPHNPRAAR